MPAPERLTVTLPSALAADVQEAVVDGAYASSSEVVLEALRDWQAKRTLQLGERAALQAELARGLEDVAAGRVLDFDADRIIERGRKLSAGRSTSA